MTTGAPTRMEVLEIVASWHAKASCYDNDYQTVPPLLDMADAAYEWVKTGNVSKINEGNK